MGPLDDLSRFCCLNPDCPDHGQRGHGNLTACGLYGPHRRRLPYCRSCEARFPERKGTPLFDSRLPPGKALGLLRHLADGRGARQSGRLVGVNKNTAARYGALAGGQARNPHDELVALSPPGRPRPRSMRSGPSPPAEPRSGTGSNSVRCGRARDSGSPCTTRR
jgi:transposase-like protein